MKRVLLAAAVSAMILSGCSSSAEQADTSSTPTPSTSPAAIVGCGTYFEIKPIPYCIDLHQQYRHNIKVTDVSADAGHPATMLTWQNKDLKGNDATHDILVVHQYAKDSYQANANEILLLSEGNNLFVCEAKPLDGINETFGKTTTLFVYAIQADVCNPKNWYMPNN